MKFTISFKAGTSLSAYDSSHSEASSLIETSGSRIESYIKFSNVEISVGASESGLAERVFPFELGRPRFLGLLGRGPRAPSPAAFRFLPRTVFSSSEADDASLSETSSSLPPRSRNHIVSMLRLENARFSLNLPFDKSGVNRLGFRLTRLERLLSGLAVDIAL